MEFAVFMVAPHGCANGLDRGHERKGAIKVDSKILGQKIARKWRDFIDMGKFVGGVLVHFASS